MGIEREGVLGVWWFPMRHLRFSQLLIATAFVAVSVSTFGQAAGQTAPKAKPEDTEIWTPEPKVVTPAETLGAPPSDAIVLFDGKNQDEWVNAQDKSPAKWTVADGTMTVVKGSGGGKIGRAHV